MWLEYPEITPPSRLRLWALQHPRARRTLLVAPWVGITAAAVSLAWTLTEGGVHRSYLWAEVPHPPVAVAVLVLGAICGVVGVALDAACAEEPMRKVVWSTLVCGMMGYLIACCMGLLGLSLGIVLLVVLGSALPVVELLSEES
ncbi:hypothetical protein C1Y63_08060 [Corynebacterium sp. 13CS0277]|uniref:hypothetical protein n=1 Tax=Corynebacterium sp. 13CS0277 TaxID=2071994 RepID=UPI000D03DACF|nr:hypothetical protein [Corynebacterium sp. 13CS0277]PRQ11073.1 hypothetical protein C1Y63_08060 [Corynebacterium sp. 13CS0277]